MLHLQIWDLTPLTQTEAVAWQIDREAGFGNFTSLEDQIIKFEAKYHRKYPRDWDLLQLAHFFWRVFWIIELDRSQSIQETVVNPLQTLNPLFGR